MLYRKLSILALLAVMLIGVACAPQPPAEPAVDEPAEEQADNATTTCEAGFRPFVDVTGEPVCVPDAAERIVAIHDINAGAQILSLGGPLVGMASRDAGFRDDITRYFDIEGITDVGLVYEPNIERILELEPDLIVHEGFEGQVSFLDESVVTALRDIAPLVAIDTFRPVEAVMADYQALLGDAATVSLDDQQAEFEALVADIEAVLGDEWPNTTVSLVDVSAGDGNLQIWGPTALVPLDILTRAGATWVPIMEEAGSAENGGYIGGVSLERIDELEADLTLVDVRFTPETVDNPLYQQLPAVEAGQVILLDEPYSGTHYPNYIATAEILLDDLTALGDIDTELVAEAGEPAAQGDAYPVTIEHKFGSITLEQRPERIVSIGYTEQDPLYALGADPVAVRYWYGDPDDAIFPWAEDEAGDADPVVLNMPYGNLNYEAILALEPDLISAIGSGITQEEYETLSQIAPVLAQSGEYVDFGSPWQVTTRTIGRALGIEAQAEALVADLEAQFEEVREQNPQFQDATVAVAYYGRGTYGYYTAQDGRGRFFTDLGFVVPDRLNEIAGESFYADISEERVELLDQDLLVFLGLQFGEDGSEAVREFIEDDPLIQQLDTVQDGQVLYVADTYDDALQFTTVLSLEFLLENFVPEIAGVFPAQGG
ncbi:MAG: ABC transporter substrate-binding protein [Chloroflexi bacterium]|nr:ABC transporter substrate-binding protein [Chloroflexota bacterium]